MTLVSLGGKHNDENDDDVHDGDDEDAIVRVRLYYRLYPCMHACMHACMHGCMYVCMCMCMCEYLRLHEQ